MKVKWCKLSGLSARSCRSETTNGGEGCLQHTCSNFHFLCVQSDLDPAPPPCLFWNWEQSNRVSRKMKGSIGCVDTAQITCCLTSPHPLVLCSGCVQWYPEISCGSPARCFPRQKPHAMQLKVTSGRHIK